MNILIIGATRGIGIELLTQALDRWYQLAALVRNKASLTKDHKNLKVIQGDILDADSVNQAVSGQDAVCVSIGIKPTRKPVSVFSEGTKNVIEAMQRFSVEKLICVTGIGAGDSKNHGGFLYDRIFNPLLLKTVYADKDVQESMVRESGLEWIIVRPGFLTNGPRTGQYRAVTDLTGVTAGKISRADVAHFILDQLSSPSYMGQTPLLMY
ncbi:MAG: SDR family oxidoreductase [Acidobacteria bacterium]|nr:SDR family oxidoreductase [Acidobacteriota bacterium]